MKKLWSILWVFLWVLVSFSCGAAKRSMEEKAAQLIEKKANEMGLDVEISGEVLKKGLAEGLAGEALEEILEPGVDSLTKQLEAAFSDEALEGLAESMGALDAAFETDAEGNIINMHFEDENGVINMDGSTQWPEEMPAKIAVYEEGLLFSYQIDDDTITLIIGNTTEEYAESYIRSLKKQFRTHYEVYQEEWVYVGVSDEDGIVASYDSESFIIQYQKNTDFIDAWNL